MSFGIASAAPPALTYQGRIVKADRTPLEYSNVSFLFQIIANSGSCVVYEEQVNGYNMVASDGVFDTAIGLGNRSFPLSGSFTVLESLDNSKLLGCKGGANYSPQIDDGRKLRVQFHDGNGWKLIQPDTAIRTVPYSAYALTAAKLGQYSADAYLLKAGIPNCGTGTVLAWSGAAFSCVTLPASTTDLSGVVMKSQLPPACSANQTLTYLSPSGNFTCSNISISATQVSGNISGNAAGFTGALVGDVSGTQTTTSVDKIKGVPVSMTGNALGKVLQFDGTNWSPADLPAGNAGTVTGVTSANNYITVAPGTVPELTLNVGTTAGTVAAGNDSRIVNAIRNAGNVVSIQAGLDSAKGAASVNGRIYIATDTQRIYRDNGAVLEIVASVDAPSGGGGGTVTSVTGTAPIIVNNSSTTPDISMSPASTLGDGYLTQADWNAFNSKLGAVTNSAALANAKIWIGDSGGKAQEYSVTGEISLSASGVTRVSGLQGRPVSATAAASGTFLKYDGTSWAGTAIAVSDVSGLSTALGSKIDSVNMPASCAANQTLTFSSPTGNWLCSNISITGAAFGSQAANLVLASPNGVAGTPSYRGLVMEDLPTSMKDGLWDASAGNVYRTTGRVGIGTAAPNSSLHVSGGGIQIGESTMTSGNPKFEIFGYSSLDSAAKSGHFYVDSAGSFTFKTDSTYLVFDSGGYVQFDKSVNLMGGVLFKGVPTLGLKDADATLELAAGPTYTKLLLGGSNVAATLIPHGNVGIGNSAPQAKLDVSGTIRAEEICDETGANCKDISSGWSSGATVTPIVAGTGLAGGTITTSGTVSIAPAGVTATELAANAVVTSKVNDGAITGAKLEAISGLTAGVYGSASAIPAVTVDAKGRVTAISTNTITGLLPTAVGASGKYLTSNGTNWIGADAVVTIGNVKNSLGNSVFTTSVCAANKALSWTSASDTFVCQDIGSLDGAAITTGTIDVARLPSSVTNSVWSADSGNVYRSSGNVGIGTSNPYGPLHIHHATSPYQYYTSTSNPSGAVIGADATSFYIIQKENKDLSFGTNNTEKIRILANGNIGVGTSTPDSNLDVVNAGSGYWGITSTIASNDGATAGFSARSARGTIAAKAAVQAWTPLGYYGFDGWDGTKWGYQDLTTGVLSLATQNWTSTKHGSDMRFLTTPNDTVMAVERMYISESGKVGIGTTNPSAKLQVEGAIVSTPSAVATGATVNLAGSNTVTLDAVGGPALTLQNMVHGGTYTLVIKDTTSRTYTFGGCTTSKFRPANGPTLAGSWSMYTVLALYNGTNYDCLITWATGYQ